MLICYLFASKRSGVSYNVMEYHTNLSLMDMSGSGTQAISTVPYCFVHTLYVEGTYYLVSSPPGRRVADYMYSGVPQSW
jgi:hypothetical protein